MARELGWPVVVPFVTTALLFFVVVFAVDASYSTTIADLTGLGYLLVAPFLYRWLCSTVDRLPGATGSGDTGEASIES